MAIAESLQVSQTSKMELLEKIVKIFKEIAGKLTCSNSSCKVAASKALISMQQDSTREKIWRRTLLKKSAFKVTEKEKPSWMLSKTCSLLKMEGSCTISSENHCDCGQIRSYQILTSVTVLKHCIIS